MRFLGQAFPVADRLADGPTDRPFTAWQTGGSKMRPRNDYRSMILFCALAALFVGWGIPVMADENLDLTHATLVVRNATTAPLVERTAATVLTEEVEKRSGVKWRAASVWPKEGWAIAIL